MKKLPKKTKFDLKFLDLTYSVPKGKGKGFKSILNEVSGRFLHGEISAILGPSGAGKTTLMNILAGYKASKISGEILVNNKPRCLKSFRKQSCYIMQDEQLLEVFTVQESMEAAAALKLGNNIPNVSKNKLIADTLSTLGLNECKHTRVSNLSGGERKRLSIAFELINNPPVMFFDEPTSGLDSQSAYQCIMLLEKLAKEGRIIICTIHQPSARLFEKFDYIYALAEGQCVYRGNVPGLLPHMSSISLQCPSYHNPADFLLEVVSGEYGNFVNTMVGAINKTLFVESDKSKDDGKRIKLDLEPIEIELIGQKTRQTNQEDVAYFSDEETNIGLPSCSQSFISQKEGEYIVHYSVSFWTQFHILFLRTFRSVFRDKILTYTRLAFHIAIAIFTGVLYFKIGNEASLVLNNVGYLFFCILFYLFISMMLTTLTFPLETKVLIREHLNNWYSLKAYYLAKTLADTPFQIVFSLIYIIMVYFMTSQPPEVDRFLIIAALGILNSLISQSIGLAIGAALDMEYAIFLAPVMVIPPLMFSGFFILPSAIPVYLRWLTNISFARYCLQASFKITYGYGREELPCSEAFCFFKNPKRILKQFDIEDQGLFLDFLALLAFFVTIRILGYFILRWKIKRELN